MKPSKEVIANGHGYIRETGWNHSGFTLLVEPDSATNRFVVYCRGRLESSNLLSFHGVGVNSYAKEKQWTPNKLFDNPTLIRGLFETLVDNLVVLGEITTEVHADDRRSSTVLHERVPILELAGIQTAS